jgi:hypothetical protein
MLCTHCVHPLCNLPSFSGVEARFFEDLSLDWEGLYPDLHPQALFPFISLNALLSCLALPLIHQDRMSCIFYVIVCPWQFHCLLLFLSFSLPLASMPLMRLFNIFV